MIKYKEFRSVTNDSVRVQSDDGFIIAVVGQEWRNLREELWRDAYSKGCISKDMARVGITPDEAVASVIAEGQAKEEAVRKAMLQILENGDPKDVDSLGRPKISAIKEITGEAPSSVLRDKIIKEIYS